MKTAIIALSLVLAATPALAKRTLPSPFTPFTPPNHVTPSPKPAPVPSVQKDFQDILSVKTELISILQEVVTDQAGVLNTTTGQSWDAPLIMCLNGNPGSGTPGQAGYVAPMPGLISWLQNLPTPSVSSVPPVVDQNNAAEVAEHVRLLVIAGLQDAGNLVNILQANGSSLKQEVLSPCASFAQDATITVPAEVTGQIAAIIAIVKPWIPAAMAAKSAKHK